MTFVSYAQNFEDVMLWRALKHLENGFYVDAGAFSPEYDSVTRAFYDAGWSGINIEPNPAFVPEYQAQRPRDIHVCAAISDTSGFQDIYFVSNGGLSSLDQDIAESHSELGWTVQPEKVQVRTLADILGEYADQRDIHFLKIDVEGLEEKAIRGNDWTRFRPWILIVEATLPMSQVENHDTWEPLLLNADYEFVYADGLNRFYVSKDRPELKNSFGYPPNVFDDFVRHELIHSQERCSALEQEKSQLLLNIQVLDEDKHTSSEAIKALEARLAHSLQEIDQLRSETHELRGQIDNLVHSRSWRMTRPLRAMARLLRQ